MRNFNPIDVWCFAGAKALNNVLKVATQPADGGRDPVTQEPLTTLTCDAHGFLASSGDFNSLIFINGTTNYDGLKKIYSVATNTITIYAKYVEEDAFAGTETVRCAIQPNYPFEYLGIEVTLSAAGGEATALTLTKDSILGSAFDHVFHKTADMTSIQWIDDREDPGKVCEKDDILILGWANGQAKTFGAKIFTRRLM